MLIFPFTLGRVWIGLSNSTIWDGWTWVATKRKLEKGYKKWATNEPSGDGDCAHINVNNEWNDAKCKNSLNYVCDMF